MSIFGKDKKEQLIEQILLEHYDRYYRLAFSYVHQDADAADIVQTGAYQAIRNCRKLQHDEYAATWVYRIMLNEIFRFCKAPICDSLEAISEESGQEPASEDIDQNTDLKEALDSLDPRDQAVVKLRFFEDQKLDEIAQILQEPVSTVKSRLYRSIKKLRIKLDD